MSDKITGYLRTDRTSRRVYSYIRRSGGKVYCHRSDLISLTCSLGFCSRIRVSESSSRCFHIRPTTLHQVNPFGAAGQYAFYLKKERLLFIVPSHERRKYIQHIDYDGGVFELTGAIQKNWEEKKYRVPSAQEMPVLYTRDKGWYPRTYR